MLEHLHIKNFTIIKELNLDFNHGMTVLTGETGAGKSIIVDALELALGGRADSKTIRHGETRCEIIAAFNIGNTSEAIAWLEQHDLEATAECIIRRILSSDGRSRNTINGIAFPQQLMREFGSMLVNIHGQHEHQNLLKPAKQRNLLDAFGKSSNLAMQVKQTYHVWYKTQQQLTKLRDLNSNRDAQLELLTYQIEELQQLDLTANELEQLHQEHKRLNNASDLITKCQELENLLNGDETGTVTDNLHYAHNCTSELQNTDQQFAPIAELLNNATINVTEAADELQHYLARLELDPERLQQVEQRLEKIYDLAHKHHIPAEQLFEYAANLQQQLDKLQNSAKQLQDLEQQLTKTTADYNEHAKQLSAKRKTAACKLEKLIGAEMQRLNMHGGQFAVRFSDNLEINANGQENIEFLVSANPGQPPRPLHKVASGGELSRISLAIQVITFEKEITPTLIFDEVDVGIGGKTAQIVGKLLHTLGQKAQVLCITHLPQVAAQGDNHLQVTKNIVDQQTHIAINALQKSSRIDEIARMLGGAIITAQTRANAKELLGDV